MWPCLIHYATAALSSMLTVALGSAITADTVYSENGLANDKDGSEAVVASSSENYGSIQKQPPRHNLSVGEAEVRQDKQKLPRWAYQGMMWLMVAISTAIVAANGKIHESFYKRKRHIISFLFLYNLQTFQLTGPKSLRLPRCSTVAFFHFSHSVSWSASTI